MNPSSCSHESKARFFWDRAFSIVKGLMMKDEPISELEPKVKQLKDFLSVNANVLGEDFVIEKGKEIEILWDDYLNYKP